MSTRRRDRAAGSSAHVPRIYLYIQTTDSGFAPNPFHGWCTLACCKPAIRRKAKPGDWVVGITPRADGNRLAFAMKVDESLSFEQYWADSRFKAKRPPPTPGRPRIERCGDNCYQPTGDGEFTQLPRSGHWDKANGRENLRAKAKDLGGQRVLVSGCFSYFGDRVPELPEDMVFKRPERFNRVISGGSEHMQLLGYLVRLPPGIHGRPRHWQPDDLSWKEPRQRCG